jgi:hypothetical protein
VLPPERPPTEAGRREEMNYSTSVTRSADGRPGAYRRHKLAYAGRLPISPWKPLRSDAAARASLSLRPSGALRAGSSRSSGSGRAAPPRRSSRSLPPCRARRSGCAPSAALSLRAWVALRPSRPRLGRLRPLDHSALDAALQRRLDNARNGVHGDHNRNNGHDVDGDPPGALLASHVSQDTVTAVIAGVL